ncbi:hypothetical protein GWO13_03310, partial [Candidatus Bathyarchaeota archaeon]|nr:hypothetical protein [Candidatus Bathyarchaeota archaeon]
MKEGENVIRYTPFKEIAIMERNKFKTPDDLARFASVATGGKPTGIYWAGGVAFVYYPVPVATEAAAKSLIEERKVYWAFVSYALMPEYQPRIETKERIIVPVIDMSTSQLFQKVARWL